MPKAREFEKLNTITKNEGIKELNMLEEMPVQSEEPEENDNEKET